MALTLAALGITAVQASGSAQAYYDAIYNNAFAYEYAPTRVTQLDNCDDCQAVLTLPFYFKYYGAKYNQITVSTNGAIVVGSWSNPISWTNQQLKWEGAPVAPERLIAPLWDDWTTVNGGAIWAGMVGDHYVVEWYYVAPNGALEQYAFELKLYPDGRIEFHYMDVAPGNVAHDRGSSATIGYQNAINGLGVGHPVSYNWPIAVANSTSMAFLRPAGNAYFMTATDFLSPAAPRAQQFFQTSLTCANGPLSAWTNPTNASGVARATPGGCAFPIVNPGMTWGATADGVPVSSTQPQQLYATETLPEDYGAYFYYRQTGFTPAPSLRVNLGTGGWIDYWTGQGVINNVLLIVPGFDPLDSDTTTRFLALMSRVAPTLLAEGYDIAIGDYYEPWQSLDVLTGQVQQWVADAYTRNWGPEKRIQVAGVSQGGVLVRKALTMGVTPTYARAWYSIDAPQKGANLGNAAFGLYSLIYCNKDQSDPKYRSIDAYPAKQLAKQYTNYINCDCGSTYPENDTCQRLTWAHDTFFGTLGWPSVKGYALAFGDATNKAKLAANSWMWKFNYNNCPDADRGGTSFDCNAGSRHIVPSDVYTSSGTGVPLICNNLEISMLFSPAFINVDSALAAPAYISGASDPNFDPACWGNYVGSMDNSYWHDTWKNVENGLHAVLPNPAADKLLEWVRQN